jgi:hypothetical protein
VADEIMASIFCDPNPGMASSSLASLHHTIVPPFFDSSMYTGPGVHWTAPHDYFLMVVNRSNGLKLQRTPIPSLFFIVDKGGEELD